MKWKQKPVLLASLFAFFSLFLVWGFLKAKEARFNSLEEPVSVLVAKKDILEGTRLDESLLQTTQIPRRFLQPKGTTSLESVVGFVSAAPILKGEQILETKLMALSSITGLAVKIPQGMRALSLDIDDAGGVAGLVRPNNFVDILATFEVEDSTDTASVTTQTVAQKILVLAVGEDLGSKVTLETVAKNSAKKSFLSGGAFAENVVSRKKTITLCVTPRQAQTIEFAKTQSKISLALRPLLEEEPLSLSPTTMLDVLGMKGHVRNGGYKEYRGR